MAFYDVAMSLDPKLQPGACPICDSDAVQGGYHDWLTLEIRCLDCDVRLLESLRNEYDCIRWMQCRLVKRWNRLQREND